MYQFKTLSLDQFNEFSQIYPQASFVQSASMAQVHLDQGRQVEAYGVEEQGKLVAAGLFSIRKVIAHYTIAQCNQGPLIDFGNPSLVEFFFDNVQIALKKHHCLHALITPNFEVYPRDINGEIVGENDHLNWIDHLQKANVNHLGFDNGKINGIGRWMFVKDLTTITNEDELMLSFDHSTRKAIRKTIKDKIDVEELDVEQLATFKQLSEITAERRQFKDRSLSYYESLKRHFGEQCKVLIAQFDVKNYYASLLSEQQQLQEDIKSLEDHFFHQKASKKMTNRLSIAQDNLRVIDQRIAEAQDFKDRESINIGGVIYTIHSNEMTALFAGNDAEFFGFNATHAIHYVALKQAVKQELTRFNFYGTQGPFCGIKDDGVYRFKKGFGGYVLEQPGNFELIVNPFMNKLYRLIQSIKSKKS